MMDYVAQAKGLPTYEDFHQTHNVTYNLQASQGGLIPSQQGSTQSNWVPENQNQIYSSLEHAQAAKKLLDLQAQVLERNRQITLAEQQRQTEHIAWAKQYAAELRQRYAGNSQGLRQNQAAVQNPSNNLVANSGEIITDVPDNLVAEAGSMALRYHDVMQGQGQLGENSVGKKSHKPPKPLSYQDNSDLAVKLYQHFVAGQGQPVEISLHKLDFARHIDLIHLLSMQSRQAMLSLPYSSKLVGSTESSLSRLIGKDVKVIGSNAHITVIEIPSFNVLQSLDISPSNDTSLFAAFGKIRIRVKNIEIYINRQSQTVTVAGEIEQKNKDRLLDTFDFDPAQREWYKELLTDIVHTYAPPGSTSFKIFARQGTSSVFRRSYPLSEFSH